VESPDGTRVTLVVIAAITLLLSVVSFLSFLAITQENVIMIGGPRETSETVKEVRVERRQLQTPLRPDGDNP
jgi:hypothetical protein